MSNQNGDEEAKKYNEIGIELQHYNDQTTSSRYGNSWPRPYLEDKLEKL